MEIGDGYVWFWNQIPNFYLPSIDGARYLNYTLPVHPDYWAAINAAKAKFLQSGDANGDGFVGADDLVTVLSNWGRSPAGRTEGDLNGDSLVGADDYVQVLTYWGTDYTGAEPVPEPATMFIILAGGLPAVRSRRYR